MGRIGTSARMGVGARIGTAATVACVLSLLLASVLASCSGADTDRTILVMAAASLGDAFADIESDFEAANPGVDVQLNLAGSSSLREQILQGAPADVFASANESTMAQLADAHALAGTARIFATNRLMIAVPVSNPGNVASIADLADADLLVGLCDRGVPCGDAARAALERAGVAASIDTNEPDVRALLTKVAAGELDAGIVYVTDVASTGDVVGITIGAGGDVSVRYPIATLSDAPNSAGAGRLRRVRAVGTRTANAPLIWVQVAMTARSDSARPTKATGPSKPTRPTKRTVGHGAPWPLLVLAAIGAAVFVLPFVGLLSRTPWTDLGDLITSDLVVDALVLSLVTSVAAAVIATLLGVPLAWVLARVDFPGRTLVRAIVTLPMVLPPVVGGAALLFALGRRGLVGEPLDAATGFVLPFSTWGVVAANVFVAMPFLVITVEGALNGLDGRHEAAAATLGASRLTVFRRVTLPMIAPSLWAGIVLAWARALGEFGATVTFAGNLQGRTQTLPLAVFVALGEDRDAAVAISLVLVAISLVVLVVLRDRWWTRP